MNLFHQYGVSIQYPTNSVPNNGEIACGDCLEIMAFLPDNSIDSIVTDPPYGLGFLGKHWDHGVPGVDFWTEMLRVLKPGGHLLSFGGSRTYHRMASAVEDAGFEIRDQIMWLYSSGFPKSLDVGKAIDKAAGAEREVVGVGTSGQTAGMQGLGPSGIKGGEYDITAPSTPDALRWDGWGTALKPAHEPIVMARKPLIGTVAANVLAHGTGALNIDGCRVGDEVLPEIAAGQAKLGTFVRHNMVTPERVGRWPANVIHDGGDEVLGAFPQAPGQQGKSSDTAPSSKTSNVYGAMKRTGEASQDDANEGGVGFKMKPGARRLDSGSAARFFYCAKASKADRDGGMEDAPDRVLAMSNQAKAELARGNMHEGNSGFNTAKVRKNNHPTVKPTDLMRYLCRLITPPSGIVLDPFMGSGSTGKAAVREGFQFLGIEREAEYFEIAKARVK